jgi:hypothetical protein
MELNTTKETEMSDPRILVSEFDGLRLYRPEVLEDSHGEMVLIQECAELIEGRWPVDPWEGFIILPWSAN